VILFITYEDYRNLNRHLFRVERNKVVSNVDETVMSATLSESTLCYTWGSASFGKLGNGISKVKHCEN